MGLPMPRYVILSEAAGEVEESPPADSFLFNMPCPYRYLPYKFKL